MPANPRWRCKVTTTHDDREARKAQAIATVPHLREVYLDGYLAGYANGFRDADQTAEAQAEHAARIFDARDAAEAHQRAAARAAAEAIDVQRRRAQQAGGERP